MSADLLDDYTGPLGWHKDVTEVLAIKQSWKERGLPVTCADFNQTMRPGLVGYWEKLKARGVMGVFLSDSSRVVNGGQFRRPFLQEHGTCVDRGTTGGVQRSLDFAIANRQIVSRPIVVQFGTTYIGARGDVGKNQLRSEGAILGQAMTCIHDIGVMEKIRAGKYDFLNMSEPDIEKVVVQLSNGKLPEDLKRAMLGHNCHTFWCEDIHRIMDCVAGGYACPYAFDYVTGKPNAKGISVLGSYGPHCRCFVGVFVDDSGRDRLVSLESWGRFPAGNPSTSDRTIPVEQMPFITVRLGSGTEKKLAPGEVGVDAEKFGEGIYHDGEVYAVSAPTGFEPDSVSKLTGGKSAAV